MGSQGKRGARKRRGGRKAGHGSWGWRRRSHGGISRPETDGDLRILAALNGPIRTNRESKCRQISRIRQTPVRTITRLKACGHGAGRDPRDASEHSWEARRSGAWLFQFIAKSSDLITQLLGSGQITTGECHRQGELKLLALVLPLRGGAGRRLTTGRDGGGAGGRGRAGGDRWADSAARTEGGTAGGAGRRGGGVSHGRLSSHCVTLARGRHQAAAG